MTKIKICGLSRIPDIIAVNEVLPDYVGFVFARSRRQITEETAGELKKLLHPAIKAVGVFVNDEPDRIQRLCERNIIDLVQLHGEEGEKYITELHTRISCPIIQAVRIGENDEQHTVQTTFMLNRTREDEVKNFGDYLLFDTYRKEQYGGSGESFDWALIPGTSRPYFLAGGIHSGNVERAVHQYHPYCVDVSSGVETDGYKDAVKIREIVKKVRNISRSCLSQGSTGISFLN
jgi:phosphoribosylanthranilate isomerase